MKSLLYQLNNKIKDYDEKLFSEDEFLKMVETTLLQKQAQVSKHTESVESHEKIGKYRDTVSKAEELISMNGKDFGYQIPINS